MACARLQKISGILRRNSSSCLKASRICQKRRKRLLLRLLIMRRGRRIQEYDMSPGKSVFPIKF